MAQGTVYIDIDAVNNAYTLLNNMQATFDTAATSLAAAGAGGFNTFIVVGNSSPAAQKVTDLDNNYQTLYSAINGNKATLDAMVSTLQTIIADAEALTAAL